MLKISLLALSLLVFPVAYVVDIQQPQKVVEWQPDYSHLSPKAQKEVDCLANNIYFESAYEPKSGQKAVAFVTLNRVKSEQFPDSICEVVKQKTRNNAKTVCQFSWYCLAKPKSLFYRRHLEKTNNELYYEIRDLAIFVYANYGRIYDPSLGSLYYHADYVRPKWRHSFVKMATIGKHIFYRSEEKI